MTYEERKIINEKNDKIADNYGMESQLGIIQEECAELIVAVSKFRRSKNIQTTHNLVEEMADVYIMLNQILYLLNKGSDNDFYEKFIWNTIERKINRQLEMMSDENAI